MDTATWVLKLNSALDSGAVVQVMREFLDSLEKVELELIPTAARPNRLKVPSDVSYWAFNLAAAWLARDSTASRTILGDVALVFAEASRRLGQVAPRSAGSWEADDPEEPRREDDSSVLVYDYEYWDPAENRLVRADFPATLEAIRNGLGQAITASGRKVRLSELDATGRVSLSRDSEKHTARGSSESPEGAVGVPTPRSA